MPENPVIRVYNTATRRLEDFVPSRPGEASIYVCGPTVYDDSHVGHARAMVAFDVIVRWLEYRGSRVRYVRNITDIDDKIITRAGEKGVSCAALAERYIRSFHEDMARLSLRPPDAEPRATEHIPAMIALIRTLVEKGLAYEAGGDVCYDVGRFPGYGALSGRDTEELRAGARVEVDERKRNPLDFVLWKAAKPGEPAWPSPWGPGRPGWHIECSAMSAQYLGTSFDIHGGGHDLIFPHHENEIAQSEGAHGVPPARYWLHNAHVTVDRTKMSKSLGNFFTLKEIFAAHDPRVVRFYLVSRHYRSPIDFSAQALAEAAAALARIGEGVARLEEAVGGKVAPAAGCPAAFEAAMDADFNATEATGVVFGLVSSLHAELDARRDGWGARARGIGAEILACAGALGVELLPREAVRAGAGAGALPPDELERCLAADALSPGEIGRLLETRDALRARREFAAADRIRAKVQALGYEIKDERGKGSTARKSAVK